MVRMDRGREFQRRGAEWLNPIVDRRAEGVKAVRKRRIGEFGMECRAEGVRRGMEERDYGGL